MDSRCLSASRDKLGDLLQIQNPVWRHGATGRKKLRAFEAENARLQKFLAEQMLDNAMLRDANAKKSGDARCQAESGGAFDGRSSGQPASGVFYTGCGQINCALQSAPWGCTADWVKARLGKVRKSRTGKCA